MMVVEVVEVDDDDNRSATLRVLVLEWQMQNFALPQGLSFVDRQCFDDARVRGIGT